MKRNVILYLATLLVIVPIDFLFLGVIAKGLFTSQVGDMLGTVKIPPAVAFYLLYVAGILIFVSASASSVQTTLLYGALFGFFCYMTFELTNMAMLKQWSWTVVFVDIAWGAFVTAISSTLGLLIANWLAPRA
jgi:uncharacterized membrane protein